MHASAFADSIRKVQLFGLNGLLDAFLFDFNSIPKVQLECEHLPEVAEERVDAYLTRNVAVRPNRITNILVRQAASNSRFQII